jgi:tagatose kinase
LIEILTAGEILVEIMRPESGIPLYVTGPFTGPFVSGAPAIFIDTVSRLGHRGAIIGGVGNDDFGKICMDRLKADGVYISAIKINDTPTGVAFVTYFKDGSRKFIYHIRDSAATSPGKFESDKLSNVKIFHIMGCSLMMREDLTDAIIEYANKIKDYGGKISFDPNMRPELMGEDYIKKSLKIVTELSDIILPGVKELYLIADSKEKDEAIGNLTGDSKLIVLKNGSKGCEIYTRSLKKPIKVPSFKIKEVDPTGAGDSFDAGFLCGYLEDKSLEECGILANACGALNTTKLGPMEGVFERNKVNKFIEKYKK